MPAFVAMLRAVNVGGNNRLSMEALRALCVPLALREVRTYIQSGNLVFHHKMDDPQTIAHALEEAIHRKAGFKPTVVVRTAAELRTIVARNPFAGRDEVLPNKLAAAFPAASPGREAIEKVLALRCEPEEMHFGQRCLYIYYPNGMARPTIPLARIEKLLGCPVTARNWNTVSKLLAMAEEALL